MEKQSAKNRIVVGDGTPGPGRKRGGQNRTTRTGREIVLTLLQNNCAEAQRQLDALKKRRPLDWLRIYARLASLVIPRIHRDDGSSPMLNINIGTAPITDAGDASRIYSEVMGRPDIDISGLRFGSTHRATPETMDSRRSQPQGRDLGHALTVYETLDTDEGSHDPI